MSPVRGSHDVVPLFLGVLQIFRRVYSERLLTSVPGRSTAHLDGLAYTVASFVPVIVYAADGAEARPLTQEELSVGLFRDGGKALYFLDGRPEIRNLALRASDIEPVAQALKERFPLDDDMAHPG
jgi:hypothetical protein